MNCLRKKYPYIQKNRLIEHWEKKILPRILDFCKGTLKQYEIDDYFE